MELTLGNRLKKFSLLTLCLLLAHLAVAQTPSAASAEASPATSALPRLVRFTGTARDLDGKPLTGVVGITFALYAEQTGGAPLFLETQNAQADSTGHYSVLLGSTKPDGLPSEIFDSEQARWIGVQLEQQVEQPRTLLVSAPYALKAGDAETLGGFPPSAFLRAAPGNSAATDAASRNAATKSAAASPKGTSDVTTTGGTLNTIPMFTPTASNIQNSLLTQTGTTAINVGGKLNLPATGTATASAGFNSQPQNFVASSFNGTTSTVVPQTFQWQAEPVSNDKSSASATLNLRFGAGATAPGETGLNVASNGQITFAKGQTFPAAATLISNGTVNVDYLGLNKGTTVPGVQFGLPGGGETISSNRSGAGLNPYGLDFYTDYTPRLSILQHGNVGIGTKAPVYEFEVYAAGATKAEMAMVSTGTDAALSLNNTASGGREYLLDSGSGSAGVGAGDFAIWDNTAEAARLVVNSNGNVGIGTKTPGAQLEVDTVSPNSYGVKAVTSAGIAGAYGVLGSPSIIGGTKFPIQNDENGGYFTTTSSGVWADTNWNGDGNTQGPGGKPLYKPALFATADANFAAAIINNSNNVSALYAYNLADGGGEGGNVVRAVGTRGSCTLSGGGDAACTGVLKSVVATTGGAQRVETYSVQSAENWFEDAGTAQLVNGSASVNLESVFGKTVNTGVEYHVFLTPDGDCRGLYVGAKTASGFEVHELGGGASNIAFEYRIMAKRVGYETVRLKDVTKRFNQQDAQSLDMRRSAHPVPSLAEPQSAPRMPAPELAAPTVPAAPPVRATVQPVLPQHKQVVGR